MNLLTISLMGIFAVSLAGAAQAGPAVQQAQTRCGWWDNPTPQNASLLDRGGKWVVGVQGGYQAQGDWPDFKDTQWVATNGHYGYGCACLDAILDPRKREIIRIRAAHARPLSACRQDPALKGLMP